MTTKSSEISSRSEKKKGISGDQICELQASLDKLNVEKSEESKDKVINHMLATQKDKGNTLKVEWIIDSRAYDHMMCFKDVHEYKLS